LLVLSALADKFQFAPREALEQNYKTQYANAKKIKPWFDRGLLLRLGEQDPPVKVARRRA
jgi:hypothetical protein